MPLTVPATSLRNLTPSSTEPASPESTVPGVARSKIVSYGVTEAEAVESGPGPEELIAATLKVYAVPFVRPPTLAEVAVEPVVVGDCAVDPM